MPEALARHDTLVRKAVDRHDGHVFATGGDGFAVVFARAGDAVAAALEAQAALGAEEWPADATIRVRMGLHTGEVVERDGDYFGPAVNLAARLMDLGHGGQVLASGATAAVTTLPDVVDLGTHRLRDVVERVAVLQVGPGRFPALRSVGSAPSNLPTAATPLIGRDEDLAVVA